MVAGGQMIETPDKDRKASAWTPDDLDMLSWGADDVGALTHLLGNYAYVAAEETIYGLYKVLRLEEHELGSEMSKRIGQIADEVAAGVVDFYRNRLAESERDGTWEAERVVLERMRGNPAARPVTSS